MTLRLQPVTPLLALLLLAIALSFASPASANETCRPMTTTAYNRYAFTPHTWDGTSVYNGEAFAAASWDIPIDSYVVVQGVGTFRIADRGILGNSGWIDIAMEDTWGARQYGKQIRMVCVYAPGELADARVGP